MRSVSQKKCVNWITSKSLTKSSPHLNLQITQKVKKYKQAMSARIVPNIQAMLRAGVRMVRSYHLLKTGKMKMVFHATVLATPPASEIHKMYFYI